MAQEESVWVAVRARIDDFRKKMSEVNKKIGEVGDKMKETGDKMKGVGEKMTTSVSAPLAALGGVAMKSAADFDGAARSLQNQFGYTAEEAKVLNGVARNLWRQGFGEDIYAANEALSAISTSMGNLPSKEMEKVAKAAMSISQEFGEDMPAVTRAASQLMQQFGVTSTEAMDMIATGFQQGANFSGDFLDTVSEYSTQFSNMGYSAEQMMGMFVDGASSGIFSLDKLGDAVKESFLQITDGADGTNKALEEIGLNSGQIVGDLAAGGDKANAAFGAVMTALAGVTNEADRNRLAVELMGTPLEDLGPQFQEFFANTGAGMENFGGAAAKMGENIEESMGNKFQSSLRTAQEALLPLGVALMDVANRVLPILAAAATTISEKFAGMGEQGQMVVLIIGGIAAAIGPLLVVLGVVVGAIGNIIVAFSKVGPIVSKVIGVLKKASAIFKVVRTVMLALTGPIGLTVAAIAALIAIGIAVYKNWDQISAWLKRTWASIKAIASATFKAMGAAIGAAMNVIKTMIQQRIDLIKGIFKRVDLAGIGRDIIRGLANGISNAWSIVKGAAERLGKKLKDKFTSLFQIGSPSKLMDDEIGQPIGQGIARGMRKTGRLVARTSSWLADKAKQLGGVDLNPQVNYSAATAQGAAAASSIDRSGMREPEPEEGRIYQIEVPLHVQGREFARATARFTEEELARLRSERNRGKGIVQYGY